MVDIKPLIKPFVGLRPFEIWESEIFFGREAHTTRLLNKLHQTNFVAVVGSSGSGKSSLVRAGLIPALKAGFLNSGDHWYITAFRPGDNPLYYFAKALRETFDLPDSPAELEKAIQENGIDEILLLSEPYLRSRQSSLLILVDQFEELFTHFKNVTEQSSLMYRFEFVKIVLELIQTKLPIYVILTMRSDFIGKCNIFYGLPEALSNSQFLVPRLQYNELAKVIEGPIRLFGSDLEAGLTQKILNDLKDDEDQLPVLENALSQLWSRKKSAHIITAEDYRNIGKLKDALSNQANSIYDSIVQMDARLGPIIRSMFQYIIDFDGEKKEGVRRPRKVKDIQGVASATFEDIKTIYDAFSGEQASFLFSPSGTKLHEESIIDISHESLMREWNKFKEWKEDEEKNKRVLERLDDFAAEYKAKTIGALKGPKLEGYLRWEKYLGFKDKSKRAGILRWAQRYSIDFGKVNRYIVASRNKARVRKVVRWTLIIFSLMMAAGFYLSWQATKVRAIKEQAAEVGRRDSLEIAEEKQKSLDLATQSTAQAALYNANNEIDRLTASLMIAKKTITDKDKLLASLQNTNGNDETIGMLKKQNSELDQQRRAAEQKYANALATIEKLNLELASYKKKLGSTRIPDPSYEAKIIESEGEPVTDRKEAQDKVNSRSHTACWSIEASAEEMRRIVRVRYYPANFYGKNAIEVTNVENRFEHCLTVSEAVPVKAEILYNDKYTRTVELVRLQNSK